MWTLPAFLKFGHAVEPKSGSAQPPALLTPCIGLCELGADGYCDGCHRSAAEIGRWTSMSDPERRLLMDEILPQRAERRADGGPR